MKQIIILLTIASVLSAGSIYAYQYGDPTAAEQAHLEYINWARAKPLEVATFYGLSSLFEGVPSGSISGDPVPPLTLNKLLSEAAYDHSKDMTTNSFFSHYSQDNSSPFDRIKDTGYQYKSAGENIAFKVSTAYLDEVDSSLSLHENLFVDKDYPDRGHRVNILSPNFKEVGIGLYGGPSNVSSQYFDYSHYVTTDFGTSLTDDRYFVLGVIYEDKDNSGYYDAGEGISGVNIKEEDSGETTTSASAGGYAIPLSSGSYTFVFTHPTNSTLSKSVTVSGQNVKVDITLADFTGGSSPSDPVPTPDPVTPSGHLTQTEVSQLYIGVFGRASEGGGNSYWQTDAQSTSMTAAANVMLNTQPAKDYFGDTLSNNQDFIEHIYLNTLGKSYQEDQDGVDYWVGELDGGKSKGEVIAALIVAAQHSANAGAAQDRFNNKVEVSNYCADNIALYSNNLATFVGFISSVTDAASSVASAKLKIDAEVSGSSSSSLCSNTCGYYYDGEYASDGDCDDGGQGSSLDVCVLGTDCADCGTR